MAYASRICEFMRINPPEFIGSSVKEDLKNFMEELYNVFVVMHVAYVQCVKIVAYQLKGVAKSGTTNGRREIKLHQL